MPEAKQQRIDEILKNDPWYSPTDTRLDLSQYPHLTPLASATFEDDRFAQLDHGRSNELKKFVTDQLQQDQPDSVVHVGKFQFSVFRKDGKWRAKGNVEGQIHRFTGGTRDEVLSKLMALAKSRHPEAHPKFRELSDDEALHVARLAQSGDEPSAFGQYFLSRIGPQVATMEDPMTELLSSPKYRSICDQAAFFVWSARNDNYVPNAEFEQMVARVAESKPLNGRLITSVWIQYLDEKQNRPLNPKPEEPAETEPDPREINAELNELDDGSIDRLMRATQRQYAREVRAGSR